MRPERSLDAERHVRQAVAVPKAKPKGGRPAVELTEMDFAIADAIKARRKEKGYSQEVLAQKAGIAPRSFKRYEGGERRIYASDLVKIEGVVGPCRPGAPAAPVPTMPDTQPLDEAETYIQQLALLIRNSDSATREAVLVASMRAVSDRKRQQAGAQAGRGPGVKTGR